MGLNKLCFIVILGCFTFFYCGCDGKGPATANSRDKEPGIVEYAIGEPQLKSYQRAKSTLRGVNKAREEQNKELGL